MSKLITADILRDHYACNDWLSYFEEAYPDGLYLDKSGWMDALKQGFALVLDYMYVETYKPEYQPDFTDTVIEDMEFYRANLNNWKLDGATFVNCVFLYCRMSKVQGCTFQDCDFVKRSNE